MMWKGVWNFARLQNKHQSQEHIVNTMHNETSQQCVVKTANYNAMVDPRSWVTSHAPSLLRERISVR